MKKFLRGPGAYLILFLLIFVIASMFGSKGVQSTEVSYNEFMDLISQGQLTNVVVVEKDAVALKKGTTLKAENFPNQYDYSSRLPSTEVFEEDFKALCAANPALLKTVTVEYKAPAEPSWLVSSLPYILVTLAMLGIFWYMMSQQAGAGGGKVMSFGKSKAKVAVSDKNKKTFADVAGADEEKDELREIVEFLKNPAKFTALGARIPKGVLLVGPPGTGKTLLAKAVAGEAGVPFYSISGSDFVEMFVGVGASRVRDLFDNAKKKSPCIVFIDEIDAVGRHRGAGLGGGHDEREQTLNQLLVEMDGFSTNEGIIILAATNRPDILDPALLRPGRFDRQVTVNYPDVKGREEILKVHSKGKPLDTDVDLSVVARRTPYYTGADLENVMNEAAILAARDNKKKISMSHILTAINRVAMGTEKKSSVVTEKDKRLVAYHESGHAIAAFYLENCDPVHEVSIIPTGMSGGHTMLLPLEDTKFITKEKLLDSIAMALGGRAAEEIILGQISTGASSDLQHASATARSMVVEYGMSDKIGNLYLGNGKEVFLGMDYGHTKAYSDEMAAEIDEEIKRIIDQAYTKVKEIIDQHRPQMDAVVDELLRKEKITGEEFAAIVRGIGAPQPAAALDAAPGVIEADGPADESAPENTGDNGEGGEPETQPEA